MSNDQLDKSQKQQPNKKLVSKLVLIVFAMFGFGFALVPLYNVFCDVTGLNGKTNDSAAVYSAEGVDTTRNIKVQFISRNAQGMPWTFQPMIEQVVVHPGELKLVKFYAKNNSKDDLVGQAIPSISPGIAATYFKKIECFCFTQQPLKANEEAEMAVQFYVDPQLPENITTLTLSYTLFNVTKKVES